MCQINYLDFYFQNQRKKFNVKMRKEITSDRVENNEIQTKKQREN
jgi:hypothetical protein